jgi:hypothetical protein
MPSQGEHNHHLTVVVEFLPMNMKNYKLILAICLCAIIVFDQTNVLGGH